MTDYPSPYPAYQGGEPMASSEPLEVGQMSDEDRVPAYYYCLGWLLVLLVIAGIGFGVWWYFFRGDTEVPQEQPVVEEEVERDPNLIGKDGGTVRHRDGAYVTVPAGALDSEVRIEIEKVEEGRVTDLYHVKPDGLEFKKPVTIGIPYKPDGLYVTETPADIYVLYQYRRNGYENQLDTRVDTEEKIVSSRVSRF